MTAGDDDIAMRRSTLSIDHNPRPDIDYVVGITGQMSSIVPAGSTTQVELSLHYVPDRDVLTSAGWASYLATLGNSQWSSVEALATALFDDLINELVPRWLCLRVNVAGQFAILQDQQPNWHNSDLLTTISLTS